MSSQANTAPRALVHKRILTAAAEKPEASLEEIADEVAGASTPLVERVLEEYGDPADNDADSTVMSQTDLPIDIDELSSAQRETLAAVLEQPDATQQEIATKLDVSSATVSQRLRDIEGFDWSDRGSIVATIAESDVSLVGGAVSSQGDDEPTAESSSEDPVDSGSEESVDESSAESAGESAATAAEESTEQASVEVKPSETIDDGSSATGDDLQADADVSSTDEDSGVDESISDDDGPSRSPAEAPTQSSVLGAEHVRELEQRLTDLEETVATQREEMESVLERGISELESDIEETITDGGQFDPQPAIQDDELLAKVIRASMADDTISEEEELQIIEALR